VRPGRVAPWLRPPAGTRSAGPRLLVAAGIIGFFVAQSFYPHAADFKTFYSAGYAIRHPDIPLYDLIELDDNPFGEVFKLPPSAAVYLAPLSLLGLQEARLVWRSVLVAALVGGYLLLMRELRVPILSRAWLAGLGLWAIFGPAQIAVGEGQWDPIFVLLLAVAVAGARRSRQLLAGAALALAASIKPYPLVVVGFLIARGWWRGLVAAIVGAALFVGVGALVAGTEATTDFLTRVLPASGAATPYADNQALGGVLARAAVNDFKPLPLRDVQWVDLTVRGAALGALMATIMLVARRSADDADDRMLQLCLFVPLSIVVLPAAWTHYAAVLLVPLTVLAVDLARRRPRVRIAWAVLGLALVLLAIPNPTALYGPDLDRALWLRGRADAANAALQHAYPTALSRLVFSYKALATVLLYGLLVWRVGHAPHRAGIAVRRRDPELPDAASTRMAPTATGAGS